MKKCVSILVGVLAVIAAFYLEKLGKNEEIPKKMRNFVGAFDCIDKLKYALRQPFEQ